MLCCLHYLFSEVLYNSKGSETGTFGTEMAESDLGKSDDSDEEETKGGIGRRRLSSDEVQNESHEQETPQNRGEDKNQQAVVVNSTSAARKRKVFGSLKKKWSSFRKTNDNLCEDELPNGTDVTNEMCKQLVGDEEQGTVGASAMNARPLPPLPSQRGQPLQTNRLQRQNESIYSQLESPPRRRAWSFTSGLFERFGNLNVRRKRKTSEGNINHNEPSARASRSLSQDEELFVDVTLFASEELDSDSDYDSDGDGNISRWGRFKPDIFPVMAPAPCRRPPPLPPRVRPGEPVISDDHDDTTQNLARGLKNLSHCSWYWGPLTRTEAEKQLAGKPDGSFLVRDSMDDRHFVSLSFRSAGRSLHTRIEHQNGKFSFYPMPEGEGECSVVRLIKRSMAKARHGQYLHSQGKIYTVRLLNPVSRFTEVPSLQQFCRFIIRDNVRIDQLDKLPLPMTLTRYLARNFYSED